MTIENVVNQALDLLGYSRHVGNIYEGSPASIAALNTWAQTRDTLFSALQPEWARKDTVLTLVKSAPNIQGTVANYTAPWDATANPPLPWLYEYTTPTDCLTPLQIKPSTFFLPVWRPSVFPFRQIITDTSDTIVTNAPEAILIYVAKILDPDVWHDEFRDLVVRALAQKLQVEFAKRALPKEKEDADAPG